MRIQFAIAAILSLALSQQQSRGVVTSVAAEAGSGIGTFNFVVQGNNPCGAVFLHPGEGTGVTHPIHALPTTLSHEYENTGTFTVRAEGMGNCDGVVTTKVTVTRVRPRPAPIPTPTPDPVPETRIRFQEMDTNGDRVITRAEWRGSARSFAVHDWNGDGRLSGDEVRLGGVPAGRRGAAPRQQLVEWTEARFRSLDLNRDGRLTRNEWPYDVEAFVRVDRNGDRVITLNEYLLSEIDDDREDRFEDLDVNRDNRLTRDEWHGSLEAFRWLDRNGDGVLSRAEVLGTEADPRAAGTVVVPARSFTVSAQTAWTDTGISVRAGDVLTVTASGEIQVTPNSRDIAGPNGAAGKPATARAPRPDVDIGALVGRVGNGEPFFIGANAPSLAVQESGRLYLGPNDDVLKDNRGEFRVVVSVVR